MISDNIKKERRGLQRRGLHSDSYFHAIFSDGSYALETNTNWSDISKEMLVDCMGTPKIVYVCTLPISSLIISHGNLQTRMDINPGEFVYQSIRSRVSVAGDGESRNEIAGRVVGKVKNGIVIEERFLDGHTGEILGFTT